MTTTRRVLNEAFEKVVWTNRGLAVSAWDIENEGRLAKTRDGSADGPHQRLTFFDGGPQVRRPWRQVRLMQVLGLDPRLYESAHQRRQGLRIIVDPRQQDALAQHRNARVDDLCASFPCGGRQLAGVVGV